MGLGLIATDQVGSWHSFEKYDDIIAPLVQVLANPVKTHSKTYASGLAL